MAAVASQDRLRRFPERDERERRSGRGTVRRLSKPAGPTLEGRIGSAWSRLVAEGTADCPVCAAKVRAASPCPRCGSELT